MNLTANINSGVNRDRQSHSLPARRVLAIRETQNRLAQFPPKTPRVIISVPKNNRQPIASLLNNS